MEHYSSFTAVKYFIHLHVYS